LVTEALDLADQFGAPLIRAEAERYELVAAPTLR
jgi:hypothetical protein